MSVLGGKKQQHSNRNTNGNWQKFRLESKNNPKEFRWSKQERALAWTEMGDAGGRVKFWTVFVVTRKFRWILAEAYCPAASSGL